MLFNITMFFMFFLYSFTYTILIIYTTILSYFIFIYVFQLRVGGNQTLDSKYSLISIGRLHPPYSQFLPMKYSVNPPPYFEKGVPSGGRYFFSKKFLTFLVIKWVVSSKYFQPLKGLNAFNCIISSSLNSFSSSYFFLSLEYKTLRFFEF